MHWFKALSPLLFLGKNCKNYSQLDKNRHNDNEQHHHQAYIETSQQRWQYARLEIIFMEDGEGGGGEFVKTLGCCVDAVVTRKFGFMKWVENVNWPFYQYFFKADVLIVSPGSERRANSLETLCSGWFTFFAKSIKPKYWEIFRLGWWLTNFISLKKLILSQ